MFKPGAANDSSLWEGSQPQIAPVCLSHRRRDRFRLRCDALRHVDADDVAVAPWEVNGLRRIISGVATHDKYQLSIASNEAFNPSDAIVQTSARRGRRL